MAYVSKHRFARIAPRKARLVMDLIRGRSANDALNLLRFSRKRAAAMIDKVLRSAVANATEGEAKAEDLVVTKCWADPGPTIKRFQPKDRGKAYPIMKRTSHLVVELDERG
jgi:large subunit ribosomal protein L22